MRLRSTVLQSVLISLLITTSSSIAAQVNDPSDLPPNIGDDLGPGRDTSKDPIVLPNETPVPDILDEAFIPPLGVNDTYGPPEDPENPRKVKGMREVGPPTLKKNESDRLPVHDVRKDIGGTSTGSKLQELKLLHNRMLNPDSSVMDPEVVKQSYNKLYRELDDEARVSRSKAIRLPAGPEKSEIARRARVISNVVNSMPAPTTGKTESGLRSRIEATQAYTSLKTDILDDSILLLEAREDAQRAINSGDRERGYSALKKLQYMGAHHSARLDDYGTILKRHLKNETLSYKYIATLRRPIQEAERELQDFLEYQVDYEKAFYRKWPVAPPQKLEVPEIGPLPEVIGYPGT